MASVEESAYTMVMDCFTKCMDRFKYINKAIDSLYKGTVSKDMNSEDFIKLIASTSTMQQRSLEILNQIICRFPVNILPDEYKFIDLYRKLPETSKCEIIRVMEGIVNGTI